LTSRSPAVRVLFGSASPKLIAETLVRMRTVSPELPVIVVSEFQPGEGEWVRFHFKRSAEENRELILEKLAGREMHVAAIILDSTGPFEALRVLGRSIGGARTLVYDETGLTNPVRHAARRLKQTVRGKAAAIARVMGDAKALRLSVLYRMARKRGVIIADKRAVLPAPKLGAAKPAGISVVIPSRNGRELLERCLPGLASATEVIVVDNGSDDGTVDWLTQAYPTVIVEHAPEPLAFSAAMNRGIRRASYAHVCALNNDMVVEPGFLKTLRSSFDTVPDLFCATAQIFLPEGRRREETGKTVFVEHPGVIDLPIRCDIPFEGEDMSYVLYGSGGCSLYDAAKLAALGGFDEAYQPAYVEDLDLGVRAWANGWPSVYCAGARVLHQHRTTTSRYYDEQQLDLALEVNYTRFLIRAIGDRGRFLHLWEHQVLRLKALAKVKALQAAAGVEAIAVPAGDGHFFDLVNGEVSVFPGHARSGKPIVLVASPYLPFPLSHGAAVRIYNLLREGSSDFDFVLVAFVEEARPVPRELLAICVEAVTVLRPGTHALPSRGRPDTVEEFDTPAFHAALRQTALKWKPAIAQLEFTQMAIYREDCSPGKTILVEHDITYDLYAQMLARPETGDGETRRQHDVWRSFETQAWNQVNRVVTMSEKDRALVGGNAVVVGNGVDLERFQPSVELPEPRRLLFIGSFAHKPNVLALEFFLRDVFPLLSDVTLHVIAGQNHKRFWDLHQPGVEVEGFVSDVRLAYRRATVVIAPLVASAGTNVKIVEAMAMGKAIVSTEAGIHGLELARGADVVVANAAQEMASSIMHLLDSLDARVALERHARATAERIYGWKAMAAAQKQLYEALL
jgi:GT2 family glycosyltransferase/glycosyltransferase involved in cell wall biosynthesis